MKTTLTDDLDGVSDAIVTHVLRLDGRTVTLDLSAEHSQQLRALPRPHLAAGSKGARPVSRAAGSIRAAEVRSWAKGRRLPHLGHWRPAGLRLGGVSRGTRDRWLSWAPRSQRRAR